MKIARVFGLGVLACAMTAGVLKAEESPTEKVVQDFLTFYCYDCHDRAEQKGERNFELLNFPFTNVQDLILAKEIIDQVTLKEMPPKEEDQPESEERLAVVRALREEITDARSRLESTGGRTVMRRLSNREYENTLEVLFGRRVDTLGLTADFPKEKTSRHLDNIGQSLVTSGFLLDQYFLAAQRLVETRLGKPEMETQSWHFTDNFRQYEELSGPHKSVFNYEYLCIYEQPDTDTRQGSYGHIEDFLDGVPVSGIYEIAAKAQALHRDTHYDPKIFGIDLSEPFVLGVVPGDRTKGHIHYPQAIEPLLAQAILPDDQEEWITFRVWLEVGQTPRFIFPNGPYESRASISKINDRYRDEFENKRNGIDRTAILQEGKLPHIRISEVKIKGPLPEDGGTKEERAIFGEAGFQSGTALAQLDRFAERAFRRPLDDADQERVHGFYQKRIDDGAVPRQAALDVLKLILCSPSFFYLSEITPEENPTLKSYDLASRLSYALWAAPPDETLLAEAASGELEKEEVLRGQIERMLESPRSEGFVNPLLDGWLNLRDLGKMPPLREAARSYYAEDLPSSMKQEAREFFSHLLHVDGPVRDLLDSDYTFVDKKLAKLYDLPEKDTLRLKDGFRRVELGNNHKRGGVLGMAALLTVSANGVDTSPITRGVFISENLLGVIPPPPPDEVPLIEPDTRGAITLRERIEKHRASETCAECHRKIDPLGFGLESFDQIGRWRTRYPKASQKSEALEIDSSGEMPSGETYAGFEDFKKILVATRAEVFTKHLISMVLTHATGRHMEPLDQFEIDDIHAKVSAEGGGLRTLVTESLVSGIFRSR